MGEVRVTVPVKEVRVITPAKDRLKGWWRELCEDGKETVKFRIGRMLPLLDIKLRFGLIHALAHFWSSKTTTFIFGKHELTPTLEEYSILAGKSLDSRLPSPPVGENPVSILSEYLNVSRDEVTKVLKANRGSCPISFLDSCFAKAPFGYDRAKVFILLFFGSVIFPHKQNAIDPMIAFLAQQVHNGKNFINAILAETFISLTKFKLNRDRTFHVSPEVLQVWFLSHFSGFGDLLQISKITEFEHPFLKFKNEQNQIPDYHYSQWLLLLSNPSPVTFLWNAPWFKAEEARLTGRDGAPIPLLGVSGITEYYPIRVTRQYGVIQMIPPSPKKEEVCIDFNMKSRRFEEHITLAQTIWERCRPAKLLLPKGVLVGKVKIYHASENYIRRHIIPEEWLPLIPRVAIQDTKRAEVNRLKRKLAEAKEKTKKIDEKYKKFKTRTDSQSL